MTNLDLLAALFAGTTAGGVVAWLLTRAKGAAALAELNAQSQAQAAALSERVASRDQQIAQLQSSLTAEEDQKTQLSMQLNQESNEKAAAQANLAQMDWKLKDAASQLREAENRVETEQQKLAGESASLATARAQLDESRKSAADLARKVLELEAERKQLEENVLGLREQNSGVVEKTRFLEERLGTQRAEIESIQQKFQKEFEAVANKLLVESSNRFGAQSAESLANLLGPFRENLKDLKEKLEHVRTETSTHSALLKDEITRLGTEATNLTRALKGDVKVLGNWGENMLDQILERSGLQLGLHYRRQSAAKDGDGDQRFLDVVVELPENRSLIIDSKVSLKSYEEYVNCADEAARQEHLEAHVNCLRTHFRGLGGKRYQDLHGISAPDFVLMYVPIEAAFFVAVGREPGLFSEALERNVILITNSTLLATLRTVAHVWRLADQQKNALEIADRGGKLYDKFAGFVADLDAVGAALAKAHEVWTEASRKLHQGPGNLVGQAEKLRNLGVKASKKLSSERSALSDEDLLPFTNGDAESSPAAGEPPL